MNDNQQTWTSQEDGFTEAPPVSNDPGDIVVVKTRLRMEEVYPEPLAVKMDSLGQLIIEARGDGITSKVTYAKGAWMSVSQVVKD